MPDMEIKGSVALVTGASRGFGRAIATALSEAGAKVAGVARDRGALEELRAELGDAFTAVPADAVSGCDLVMCPRLVTIAFPAPVVPGRL
jgi:NADP-dependent 3-hydroxy acid dehydrogenase YdfG